MAPLGPPYCRAIECYGRKPKTDEQVPARAFDPSLVTNFEHLFDGFFEDSNDNKTSCTKQRNFSRLRAKLAGVTSAAFVRASYDTKSGISTLTDAGVAEMTFSAMCR